ncbi:MAG: hypothetical protein GX219_10215, partial [Tissierellia bacterium]|nr:hypothetical protein [Tissierellia bacterium]
DKWSADNIIDADGKKEGEKRERELNRWLKEVILENATSQKLESMEVIGLSDYLPMQAKNSEEEEEASLDKISSNINEITVKKVNREKFKSGSFIEEVVEIYGAEDELGDDGGIFEPTGDTNELAGGKGTKRDKKVGEGSGTAYKKIRSDDFQVRLIRQEDYYLLKLKFKKTYEQIQVHTFISGENNKARAYIKEAENSISSKKFEHDSNIINVGRIDREELSLKLHLMEDKDYSLEVEIYEIKQQ